MEKTIRRCRSEFSNFSYDFYHPRQGAIRFSSTGNQSHYRSQVAIRERLLIAYRIAKSRAKFGRFDWQLIRSRICSNSRAKDNGNDSLPHPHNSVMFIRYEFSLNHVETSNLPSKVSSTTRSSESLTSPINFDDCRSNFRANVPAK